jgi:hypothetical protein
MGTKYVPATDDEANLALTKVFWDLQSLMIYSYCDWPDHTEVKALNASGERAKKLAESFQARKSKRDKATYWERKPHLKFFTHILNDKLFRKGNTPEVERVVAMIEAEAARLKTKEIPTP